VKSAKAAAPAKSAAKKAKTARPNHGKSTPLVKSKAKPTAIKAKSVAAPAKTAARLAVKAPPKAPVKAVVSAATAAKHVVPPKAAASTNAKAAPVTKPPAPARLPGARAPGSFETKVLTALKRHGGAAVSFAASPDHIKAAFKRCLVEGWTTGTIDSASITPAGEKVLEKLNPEIRAFPAPTLRNRLNDALFRNQGNRPPVAAAVPAPAAAEEEAEEEEEEDDTVPAPEDEDEVEGVTPDVGKAA